MAGYVTPKVYGGYTYKRGDALVVKGNYYTAVNNSSASGSFSSNTTKYFYGYYTPDSGTVLNPLALMNSSSQNSVTFGFMRMDAIQSGGTANTYTITINMNGGTANGVSSMTPTYGTNGWYTFGANIPTRSGYRFKGLYTAASGGTQVYNSSGVAVNGTYWSVSGNTYKWIYAGNVTLYAQWVAIYYLDLNVYLNGSVINNTNIFHCDVTVGGTTQASNVCDYYRQHDTGSSWSVTGLTTASGYTRYSTGTTSGTLKSATSCNIYIGQNYTITYDRNGGTSGNSTQTVNYGTAWTTKGATCVKAGYTQTSWNTAANGSGTTYNLSTAQTNKQSSNLTLYAIYTGNTYYVKYNANGGSGSMSNSTHQYGTTSNLTANAFKRTGYTFVGWNRAADGSGQALNDKHAVSGMTTTAGETVTLYAQWAINSYTLYIRPNGGSWNNSTSNADFTLNYNATKAIANPTRTGYTFGGWSKTAYGVLSNSTSTNSNFSSSNTSNLGEVNVYNNAGDGTVTIVKQVDAETTPFGTNILKIQTTASSAEPGLGGFYQSTASAANQTYIHTFVAKIPVGYSVYHAANAVGSGSSFTWLTSCEGTGDWKTYSYKLTTGASGTFSTFGYVYIQDNGANSVTWYLTMADVTNMTSGSNTITMQAGNSTLTAVWVPNNYTITYDANEGYNSNQTQNTIYDTSFTTKGAIFAKPHYVQTGWNTKADGTGTAYSLDASYTYSTAGNLTLYAQYRALTKAEKDIYLYNDGSVEAVAYAKTSDIYGFAGGVVCAKDFTIGTPASSPSKTMQFTAMRIKNLS